MGLDTTHNAWHGAYSAFSRWRDGLARAAGYEVKRVTYDDGWSADEAQINWDQIVQKNFDGEWDETPADPLVVLIAHSDCDGVIHPEQAKPLADRLEELLPKLPDAEGGGHIGSWREKTQKFIDGLRVAAEANENLEFH
jgi:hypothetical protein